MCSKFDAYEPEKIKIGFLPGQANVSRDYIITTGHVLHDETIPFFFGGIQEKEDYSNYVESSFTQILKESPEFVVLPELFTPLYLQEKLKEILEGEYKKRKGYFQDQPIQLLLTGSFHEKMQNNKLYNYAQAVYGNGRKFLDIYKMNKFILPKNSGFEGALTPFQFLDGREMHEYPQDRMITLLETPFGRMAILICVDFINRDIIEIMNDRHVDLVFVMSMTPDPAGGKFERKTQDLGESNSALVIFCNNLGLSQEDIDQILKEGKSVKKDRVVVYFPFKHTLFKSSIDAKSFTMQEMVEAAQ